MLALVILFGLVSLVLSDVIFVDNGGVFDLGNDEIDIKRLGEMVRGGYKRSNFRVPSKTVVLSLKSPLEITDVPSEFRHIKSEEGERHEIASTEGFTKVYGLPELAHELSSCGKECYIEAYIENPSGLLNSLVKDNDSFIIVSHTVAEVSRNMEEHKLVLARREQRRNIEAIRERMKLDKQKGRTTSNTIAKYSSTSDINCYNEDWREYVIPYTSSIVVTNNQAMFWGCTMVIIAFLIVPLWMWFMNPDDPEDAGATMSMDNNLCPLIEEERWERE